MIATGIKVLQADIVKDYYKERIVNRQALETDYTPKMRTQLYKYNDSYYLIGAIEESASFIISAVGFLLFIIVSLMVVGWSYWYLAPVLMLSLAYLLDWIMYGLGVYALRLYGYRGSYKKISSSECVWVMMNGTR